MFFFNLGPRALEMLRAPRYFNKALGKYKCVLSRPIPWDVSHGIPIGMTFPCLLSAISMSLSRCITCQDVCVHQSHATKPRLPQYKVNLCRFVVMLLLRNKDQQ